MKNVQDLRDILFTQLDRLNDGETKGEVLDSEIKRAKPIIGLANQIISSAIAENNFHRFAGKFENKATTGFFVPEQKQINGAEKAASQLQ